MAGVEGGKRGMGRWGRGSWRGRGWGRGGIGGWVGGGRGGGERLQQFAKRLPSRLQNYLHVSLLSGIQGPRWGGRSGWEGGNRSGWGGEREGGLSPCPSHTFETVEDFCRIIQFVRNSAFQILFCTTIGN